MLTAKSLDSFRTGQCFAATHEWSDTLRHVKRDDKEGYKPAEMPQEVGKVIGIVAPLIVQWQAVELMQPFYAIRVAAVSVL